jgi:hypothetical protein
VVAPLIIEFASAARDRPPLAELLEGTLTVAVLALVSALAIFLRSDLLANVGPVAVLFAPLLWLSARCQPVFAAAAAFIVSLSIVWTTTFGIGYFGNPTLSMEERVLAAQAIKRPLFWPLAEIGTRGRLPPHYSASQRLIIRDEKHAELVRAFAQNSTPIWHQLCCLTPHCARNRRSQVAVDAIAAGFQQQSGTTRQTFDYWIWTHRGVVQR